MPTPECWEELGALKALLQESLNQRKENLAMIKRLEDRIDQLERDRVRLKTIGGVFAFLLTGIGVFFADAIKKLIITLFNN